ncbi:hypothetical protein Vadar_008241 [Vaccinium darrowii]|uniref:Uncharacterized protein n=1 Tax=Vaccinium darrowii TaxID=229202 RepID=A0ACB7YCN2_9ERIC|nr:hypothetical protein Vadar_008241 [Vaccinium darrowii]
MDSALLVNPVGSAGGLALFWKGASTVSLKFVDDCGLVDLGFSGYPFTWRNNRCGDDYVQERLDRVLASPSWCLLYDQASVSHLDTVGSDHSAILLNLRSVPAKRRVPFRFDARWVENEEVHEVIRQAWANPVHGSQSFMVVKKIQACRASLSNWKRRKRADSRQIIDDLKARICTLRNANVGPQPGVILNLKKQLKEEWDKEELFWKQKSRVVWLQHGDKNTRFFHTSVMKRRSFNHISGIEDANGVWINDPCGVQSEFKFYFSGIFTANPHLIIQETVNAIPEKISSTMNRMLTRPVTGLEIKSALDEMEPSKAPGIDGMTPQFFQSYWPTVGEDVIAAELISLEVEPIKLDQMRLDSMIIR